MKNFVINILNRKVEWINLQIKLSFPILYILYIIPLVYKN